MIQKNKQTNAMGQKLKLLIKSYGVTQEQFAEIVGCDPRNVRYWIQKGIDSITLLKQIATILCMDWKELVE